MGHPKFKTKGGQPVLRVQAERRATRRWAFSDSVIYLARPSALILMRMLKKSAGLEGAN